MPTETTITRGETTFPAALPRKAMHPWLKVGLVALVILPAVYLFVLIQYSAIVFPYFDHVTLAYTLASYYDGTLSFSELLGPHSQTRPFVPRVIFLVNAILTDWDIRSEFNILIITIYGVLVAHLVALRHLSRDLPTLPILLAAALISIFVFSPVANTNHWWSVMLFSTLANLLITIALLAVALRQESWPINIVAAVLCWAAAYSLSNGLFAFASLFVCQQLVSRRPWAPNRFGMFWLVNFLVICAVYLPGDPVVGPAPGVSEFIHFLPVFLGLPVGYLLWYPYTSPFTGVAEPPALTVGIGVLLAVLLTAVPALRDLRLRRPEAFIFFSFTGMGLISALVTAWGRASMGGANAPRYSTYALYVVIGLIYYYAVRFAREGGDFGRLPWRGRPQIALICGFLALAAVSYVRAVPVYQEAHDFNKVLAEAFPPDGGPSPSDDKAYPDRPYFLKAKAEMHRLGLGPYRFKKTAGAAGAEPVGAVSGR